jgi:hypothetical protein
MKNRLLSILMIGLSLVVFSCKETDKDEEVTPNIPLGKQAYELSKDGKITLGNKLENPYSVENMQKAYTRLTSSSRTTATESPVRTTHYYVRFLPEDGMQYDKLKSDTLLKLYIIPFDYEVKTYGWDYHDPTLPAGSITWQYTTVKADYTFEPTIKYEILASLYLPETDSELSQNTAGMRLAGKSFVDALVDEAMVLTKNYSDTLKVNTAANGRTSWDPRGTVQVFDTRLARLIPLVGVKMRARRWFDIREGYTNAAGYYQLPGFKREANYALFYETGHFDVRTGTFGQAWIDGPKQDDPWNVTLQDGVQRFYAHVFRGARRYHEGNIGDLKRPNVWSKLKYCAYDKNTDDANGDNWGNWDFTGVFPDIRIWRIVRGRERDSDEIFSTTVHETAHASHIQLMNAGEIQFLQVSNIIVESWAVAVQWQITAMEYRERGIPNFADENYTDTNIFRLRFAFQYWNRNIADAFPYTSLFIDLVDNHNQAGRFGGTGIIDNVSGYTLGGIESGFLKRSYGLSSLSNNLKANKPAGVTDAQIDGLIANF